MITVYLNFLRTIAFLTAPATAKSIRHTAFAATTLAPAGVLNAYDTVSPAKKHTADTTADTTVTARKLLHTRIDVSAGKIIRLEMSSAPIIRIPTTTVTAVSRAVTVL